MFRGSGSGNFVGGQLDSSSLVTCGGFLRQPQIFALVLKVQRGEGENERIDIMASKGEKALTGLVIFGFIGFVFYGQNGAVIGAILGGALGYFWR